MNLRAAAAGLAALTCLAGSAHSADQIRMLAPTWLGFAPVPSPWVQHCRYDRHLAMSPRVHPTSDYLTDRSSG